MAGNSAIERVRGRPFPPGVSGNPSGRPKLVVEFQKWLELECLPQATEALHACLQSENEKVRLLAVREVLDRLFGKAPQTITGPNGEPVRFDINVFTDTIRRLRGE